MIFNVDDVFEDIEGDLDNVILKFPHEILEITGWKEGDVLTFNIENGALVIAAKHV